MEEILAKLVACHSTDDDPQGRHEAIEYIAHFVMSRGMYVERYEWDGYESLVATVKAGVKKPKILLAAHVDVVVADDYMFELQKVNGKLYGRGVFDMKFAIAAYLAVIDQLQDKLEHYDIGLLITSDEEVGGKNGVDGVERLINEGYRADMVILPDGGRNWQLEASAKGVARFVLEAKGKAGHASRPWEGENAVFKLLDVLHGLKEVFKAQGPDTNTMNIGVIEGGEIFNKIPDYAKAKMEIRFNDVASLERNKQALQKLCRQYDVECTQTMFWEAVKNDLDNPYLRTFANCIESVTGVRGVGVKSFGGSDARLFAELGIPYASTYLPGGGFHGPDEWIDEKAFYQFQEVISQFLEREARVEPFNEQAVPAITLDETLAR